MRCGNRGGKGGESQTFPRERESWGGSLCGLCQKTVTGKEKSWGRRREESVRGARGKVAEAIGDPGRWGLATSSGIMGKRKEYRGGDKGGERS